MERADAHWDKEVEETRQADRERRGTPIDVERRVADQRERGWKPPPSRPTDTPASGGGGAAPVPRAPRWTQMDRDMQQRLIGILSEDTAFKYYMQARWEKSVNGWVLEIPARILFKVKAETAQRRDTIELTIEGSQVPVPVEPSSALIGAEFGGMYVTVLIQLGAHMLVCDRRAPAVEPAVEGAVRLPSLCSIPNLDGTAGQTLPHPYNTNTAASVVVKTVAVWWHGSGR
jgi:hypothetical protein